MSWKDSYSARLNYQGDYWENVGISNFEEYLSNAPNKETIIVNDFEYEVTIQDSSELDTKEQEKILLSRIDDVFNVGDVIIWGSENWIATWKDKKSIQYCNKVKIQQCNNILKFYDENHILFQVPCIFSDISIDMQEGKFMNLPIGHSLVIIPSGYITKSDLNLRFILNDAPYKIEGISNVTPGLVKIELVDDKFNEDDNRALGIANYYSGRMSRTVTILNGTASTLLYTNASLQLNIECKENGVIASNPTVTYTSSSIYVCNVSPTGLITATGTGDAIVTVNFGDSSDTINIHSDMTVQNNYDVLLSPTDTTIPVSRSKTFVAKIMNNGVENTFLLIDWNIVNSDGSSNKYCSYVVNGKSITVTGNTYDKYIILRASLQADPNIYTKKEIKIVRLV